MPIRSYMDMDMEKSEVVFIPTPLMGHAGSLIQLATLMANRFHHLSINVLVMHLPNDPLLSNYTNSLASSQTNCRINFIQFPPLDLNTLPDCPSAGFLADAVIEHHKPIVRELVAARPRLRALIVDMFCASMIDVGNEFGIPTYIFFTSNAAFLGVMFHFQTLQDEHGQDISELADPGPPLLIPSYENPIPRSVLPFMFFDEDSWSKRFVRYARKYKEAKGIIINTFQELEPHALISYDDKRPPVYPIGPMLKPEILTVNKELLQWLDDQPNSSVLLLCFGSRGCFNVEQVKQIAMGLETSGYRFIWSLREPSAEGRKGFPSEYIDYTQVLPDGFLERTAGKGKVVGWLPQAAVLGHVAVGGFVSHCGWNSILEGIWHGVPIATWPLYAEQQLDAYQLVKELGLGVEISLDYNQFFKDQRLVMGEEIEKVTREVMDRTSKVREKVKEMKAKSRMAVGEGGSSFTRLRDLVDDFM